MVPLWNENSPHWKEKAKVETANWPPSQEKEKEKKDRDIGKCGQRGRMSKDCKNVVTVCDETQEEEYEYDEEADWTDWTGALTYDDWSYGDYCDHYQDSYWTEDSEWWTDGWYDNWTWETDVAPTVPPAPSPPQPGPSSSTAMSSSGFTEGRTASSAQNTVPNVSAVHPTVKVTGVETGETHSHARPTARTVHKGPGLVGAFLAIVAVLNSFGRPQGLLLIPETVSQRLDFPDLTCHTETYHDALSA